MPTIYVGDKTKLKDLPGRAGNDLYQTEPQVIHAGFDKLLLNKENAEFSYFGYPLIIPSTALDIGAYDGRWGQVLRKYVPTIKVFGVEKYDEPKPEGYHGWFPGADIREWEVINSLRKQVWDRAGFDLVIGNPPYYIAEECVRIGYDLLAFGGAMMFLLPLDFMTSITRYNGLWNELPPTVVGVLSPRPSFYGKGTNGTEYGLYVWHNEGRPKRNRTWQIKLVNFKR